MRSRAICSTGIHAPEIGLKMEETRKRSLHGVHDTKYCSIAGGFFFCLLRTCIIHRLDWLARTCVRWFIPQEFS